MIHVVDNGTYFLGFDIPDGTKKVENNILPWDELIALVISIVGDGEGRNTGHISELCTQLLQANRLELGAVIASI